MDAEQRDRLMRSVIEAFRSQLGTPAPGMEPDRSPEHLRLTEQATLVAQLAASEPTSRWPLLRRLSVMGDVSVLPYIRPHLTDPLVEVAEEAQRAIAQIERRGAAATRQQPPPPDPPPAREARQVTVRRRVIPVTGRRQRPGPPPPPAPVSPAQRPTPAPPGPAPAATTKSAPPPPPPAKPSAVKNTVEPASVGQPVAAATWTPAAAGVSLGAGAHTESGRVGGDWASAVWAGAGAPDLPVAADSAELGEMPLDAPEMSELAPLPAEQQAERMGGKPR